MGSPSLWEATQSQPSATFSEKTAFSTSSLIILWSAGFLIGIYALIVNAEPFISNDGKVRLVVRYLGWTGGWMFLGIVVCDLSISYIQRPDLPFGIVGLVAVIVTGIILNGFVREAAEKFTTTL